MNNQPYRGFTLIELLVVVLIIGILAAVALPQYQKAIVKSQFAKLQSIAEAIAHAEQAYYLEHGKYAGNFSELDLDLSLQKPFTLGSSTGHSTGSNVCQLATMGSDAIRRGENFDIILNSTNLSDFLSVVAVWTSGPYKCSGHVIHTQKSTSYCWEARNGTYTNTPGAFCEKIVNARRSNFSTAHYIYPNF